MTDDPAALLRAAAQHLRGLATDPELTPGPWRHDPDTYWNRSPFFEQEYVSAGPAREIACVAGTGPDGTPGAAANAAYIATVHPRVGEALADWLETEARQEAYTLAEFGHRGGASPHALAIARQILAQETTP
jgi:hypothetical protein